MTSRRSSNKLLLALTGPIGSGKDTLVSYLADYYQPGTLQLVKFADPLYQMAKVLDPAFSPQMTQAAKRAPLWDTEGEPTRRSILETLGTEWGRRIRPGIWIERAMRTVQLSSAKLVVINDLRFPDEYRAVKAAGGIVVHLRPDWDTLTTGHTSDARLAVEEDDPVLRLRHGDIDVGVADLMRIIAEAATLGDSRAVP